MSDSESIIKSVSEELIEDWYAASDYGQDTFTQMWEEDVSAELRNQRIKTFEATCFYVVQNLVYSSHSDALEKIAKMRGYKLVKE